MRNRSFLLVLGLTLGLLASSCDNDSNEGETLAPISGKWDISKVGTLVNGTETLIDAPQNESGCSRDYMELKLDNTVNEGDYSSAVTACALTVNQGIYSRSHNNLTRVVDGGTTVQDIMNLTVNELKLKDSNGNIELYVRH
ncbi:lipocalin family protein [Flavobacterium humi]|uniref:Lipocalin-like domain-containing protein n=1 Tax=Flavobacterium humi TaxID=2562683 RepID=A0A4Z0L6K1_9FLAO|nr:lipocalin family protein [Flavobacterium humi]TGD57913.1 hypothetical protein E4635_07845 [Flavobacterium humi]